MTISTTPRLGLTQWSAETDAPNRSQFETSFQQIDTLVAIDEQGAASAIPTAGVTGRYYYATDTQALSRDNGTSWEPIGAPVGSVEMYAGTTSPSPGWHICDGTAVSRSTYATLYSLIGTTWGSGDGSTTFNLPDMRSRAPVGAGSAAATGLTARMLGTTGGEENHTLSTAELAAHNHGVNDPQHNHGNTSTESVQHTHNTPSNTTVWNSSSTLGAASSYGVPLQQGAEITTVENQSHVHGTGNAATGITTQNAGSGSGHNNMQPFAALTFIIRVA